MDRAAFVSSFREQYPGADPGAIERAADRKFGPPVVEIPAADARRLEKQIEHQCDVMMQKLGFEVIRFSHPGKTRQTPGISDRRYMRRARVVDVRDWRGVVDHQATRPAVCVWFECKSASGQQRPGQKLFQELVEACGEHYVLGGVEELATWLVEQKIARRVGTALEPITQP